MEIIKENLGKIIKMLNLAYFFYPNETVKKRKYQLIVELLKVWDKDKPTGTDLKNAFGRVLYPEKKEIIIKEIKQ